MANHPLFDGRSAKRLRFSYYTSCALTPFTIPIPISLLTLVHTMAAINWEIVEEKTVSGKGLVATRNLTKGSRIFVESPLLGIISEQYLPQQSV